MHGKTWTPACILYHTRDAEQAASERDVRDPGDGETMRRKTCMWKSRMANQWGLFNEVVPADLSQQEKRQAQLISETLKMEKRMCWLVATAQYVRTEKPPRNPRHGNPHRLQ